MAERLGGIKVSRTPRACSVYGDILAFADRIGNICFWNWREQSSARIFVVGWPPVKGVSPRLYFSMLTTLTPVLNDQRKSCSLHRTSWQYLTPPHPLSPCS